ncbi:hypothetical protein IFM89_030190 [Coptis chinensis]|uniref:Uncharacterized protein n=1 Tax=Coptis chinensis TaxID=261450 RepID=A0A835H0S7_9MAGN|nr:hypothetical protein IFM89_030190 [Coptis chinensis]
MLEGLETTCWGCGLRLLLSSYTPVFKCGWCGAITNQNLGKDRRESFRWRHWRDRSFGDSEGLDFSGGDGTGEIENLPLPVCVEDITDLNTDLGRLQRKSVKPR